MTIESVLTASIDGDIILYQHISLSKTSFADIEIT